MPCRNLDQFIARIPALPIATPKRALTPRATRRLNAVFQAYQRSFNYQRDRRRRFAAQFSPDPADALGSDAESARSAERRFADDERRG